MAARLRILAVFLGVGCALAGAQVRRPSADELYREGMASAQKGEYAKAELWIRELRSSYPKDLRAGTALIDVLEAQGKIPEALRAAREMAVDYRTVPQFHVTVGRLLSQQDRATEALTEYQAALRYADSAGMTALAHNLIGETNRRMGNVDQAIASFRKAKDLTGQASVLLAIALGDKGDIEGEIREYRAVIAQDPGELTALNNLAYVYSERGQNLSEALLYVQMALAGEPGNSYFVDTLGWVYYKQGRFAEAERELVRATKMEDGNSSVHWEHLAAILDARGDWSGQRRELRDLLRGEATPRKLARVKELLGEMK